MEKDLSSISSHQGNEESNPSSLEKSIKKNKGFSNTNSEKKDKDPTDMESMQRVIKKLTDDIIDLNKNKGEGKKLVKPFLKKKTDCTPQIPPTSGIKLEDYAMENYCRTHHVNHLERTCPKFINSFTAMLLALKTPKKENKNEKDEGDQDQQEEEDEVVEETSSHLNLIWDEGEISDDDDDNDIMEEACVGHDYNL